jgi:tripartite ATP-independent transporter DctM subunit
MIALLYGWCVWATRHDQVPRQSFSLREFKSALWDMRYELPLPFVILGGIFSGFLVISEAAAVTALYVLIVEIFCYREIRVRDLPRITRESMIMVGGLLLIMGCAMALTNYIVYAGIPDKFFALVQQYVSSRVGFLILLNIFLLVAGAALDIFPALIIMVPLILPAALRYGINPLHLGIIFVANMQIAYIVPPIGMNLFIASYRFKRSVAEIMRASWSFMLVLIVALLLITYIPGLSLWLVH